jgi:hypothetical protein
MLRAGESESGAFTPAPNPTLHQMEPNTAKDPMQDLSEGISQIALDPKVANTKEDLKQNRRPRASISMLEIPFQTSPFVPYVGKLLFLWLSTWKMSPVFLVM